MRACVFVCVYRAILVYHRVKEKTLSALKDYFDSRHKESGLKRLVLCNEEFAGIQETGGNPIPDANSMPTSGSSFPSVKATRR